MEEQSSPPPVGRGAERGRHIIRGLGFLTIQSVLNAFLGFVLTASLLRFLPQIGYGAYSGLTVTVGIAGVIAAFGLE
jgi:O-antigen/teichoic acid export membrane protein